MEQYIWHSKLKRLRFAKLWVQPTSITAKCRKCTIKQMCLKRTLSKLSKIYFGVYLEVLLELFPMFEYSIKAYACQGSVKQCHAIGRQISIISAFSWTSYKVILWSTKNVFICQVVNTLKQLDFTLTLTCACIRVKMWWKFTAIITGSLNHLCCPLFLALRYFPK